MIDRPRRLVLVGSVLVDVLMRVELLPERGSDVLARSAHAEVGFGRGVLTAAHRHGLPAAFAGRYGSGPFGAQVRAALVQDGVDMLIPLPAPGDSGFRVGFVETGGARTSATSPGVEAALDRQSLERLSIRPDDAVYVSGYDLTYPRTGSAIAAWARTLPETATLVFDPGPLVDDISWEVQQRILRRCDVLTMNARATRQLSGSGRPRASIAALREYAPRLGLAVLRQGADGCWVQDMDGDARGTQVPAPPIDPIDTTGRAGAHTGVLLAYLARGMPLRDAALHANAAAALSATESGAATCPDAAALERFMKQVWRDRY